MAVGFFQTHRSRIAQSATKLARLGLKTSEKDGSPIDGRHGERFLPSNHPHCSVQVITLPLTRHLIIFGAVIKLEVCVQVTEFPFSRQDVLTGS